MITRSTIGSMKTSQFEMTAVIANDYIPLFAFQQAIIHDEVIGYYNKPSREDCLVKANTIKNIRDAFEMAHNPRKININGRNFIIAKGVFLSESGETLMICSMKKEHFLNLNVDRYSDYSTLGKKSFSYSNYVLFYSTSFFTDPSLSALNRRLQKEMLQFCYEKGIEVRMLPSSEIEKNTFAKLFEVKKTKSLTQLEAYMAQVLPNFLHNGGEDTFIEQDFEPVVYEHEEELSVEQEALLYDSEAQPEEEFDDDEIWDDDLEANNELAAELAELAAEAAQFDQPLDPPTVNTEDWEGGWEEAEQAVEELERQVERQSDEEVTHITQPYSENPILYRFMSYPVTQGECYVPVRNEDNFESEIVRQQRREQIEQDFALFSLHNTVTTSNPSIELIDDTE